MLGEVTPAAAAATGLPAGLPVCATANDKAVEALGSGLNEAGDRAALAGHLHRAMTVGSRHERPDDGVLGQLRGACRASTSTRAPGSAAACGP